MSTLLTAVETANCFDDGGGRVVWQRQPRRMVSVEKRHRMNRSGGRGVGVNRVTVDGENKVVRL
jgi:hypothetical protein